MNSNNRKHNQRFATARAADKPAKPLTKARLRSLAFAYLAKREHSQQELTQKLLAKGGQPANISELLAEFATKNYQSDHRTAAMLVRQGVFKGYGRKRIALMLKQHGVAVANLTAFVEQLNAEQALFTDITHSSDSNQAVTEITNIASSKKDSQWLTLAVTARIKRFGEAIPTEAKEKARQLRFLQYRGFNADICYQAIKLSQVELE